MPIVDVQVVVEAGQTTPSGCAESLAEALAAVLHAPPGRVWLRLQHLPHNMYAENGAAEQVLPVFVRVLHADTPPQQVLVSQAASIANAVATCLNRPTEKVHIEFAPAGRGRVAFGGELLR